MLTAQFEAVPSRAESGVRGAGGADGARALSEAVHVRGWGCSNFEDFLGFYIL